MRVLLCFIGFILVSYGVDDGAAGLIMLGLFMIGMPVTTAPVKDGPAPRTAFPQALDMEAELIQEDYESEIRAVQVEFWHRPLDDDSIAELEFEVWVALTRREAAVARLDQRAGLARAPSAAPGTAGSPGARTSG